jgi:hypothetical protein
VTGTVAEATATGEPADVPVERAGPPFRLRDLRGYERWVAAGAFALVLVPFVVALVRAYGDGWVPSGDEANIATRALDVFSKHPPLTGLPSTSYLYGDKVYAYHPGPFEFYLLAVPLRVLGQTTGPLLTASAINAFMVCVAMWAVFRRLGFGAMLWAAVLLQAVMWALGTSILTDTLSSNMTMYPGLGTAALAWAIADGDHRLLPLGAVVGSYAAQQHLAASFVIAALVLYALVSLTVVARRRRRRDGADAPAVKRWALGALGIALLCWLPPIVDEIKGRPGNLTALWDFGRDSGRPTLGWGKSFRMSVHAVVPPTVLARTDTVGTWFIRRVDGVRGLGYLAVVLAVIAVVVLMRRQRPSLARLGGLALVLLAAGLITGSNIPDSVEQFRPNLYRWAWTLAFFTWLTIGIAVAHYVRRLPALRAPKLTVSRLAPVALLLVAALVAGCTASIRGEDDTNRESRSFHLEKIAMARILANIDHDEPITLVPSGNAALTVSGHIIFGLVKAGVPVRLRPQEALFLGRHRRIGDDEKLPVIVVQSGLDTPKPPGKVLVDTAFDPRYTRLADRLVEQANVGDVEFAPDAAQIIDRKYGKNARAFIEAMLRTLQDPDKTRSIVGQPVFLDLVLAGVLTSPTFDRDDVRAMQVASPHRRTVLNDEELRVSILTPDELREFRARL